jgi:hypothetical protein
MTKSHTTAPRPEELNILSHATSLNNFQGLRYTFTSQYKFKTIYLLTREGLTRIGCVVGINTRSIICMILMSWHGRIITFLRPRQ